MPTDTATTTDPLATVYTTRTGKTFHTEYCSQGTNRGGSCRATKTKTTIRAAVRNHLTPCTSCKPPTYTGPMR